MGKGRWVSAQAERMGVDGGGGEQVAVLPK